MSVSIFWIFSTEYIFTLVKVISFKSPSNSQRHNVQTISGKFSRDKLGAKEYFSIFSTKYFPSQVAGVYRPSSITPFSGKISERLRDCIQFKSPSHVPQIDKRS